MRLPALALPMTFAAVASCSPPEGGDPDRFGASGELIAMSGAGAGAANACFTCHGLRGEGDGAGVPRLAGLDSGYLQHQLETYADGRRQNETMRWIAMQLAHDERLMVSNYYARLPWSPESRGGAVEAPQLFVAGDPGRNLPACASCHGVDGLGIGAGIPPLAGQPAAYIVEQLENWRRGKRRSDPDDVMLEIARSLTRAEARALASYASALPAARRRPGSAEEFPSGRRSGPRNDASELPRRVAGS